MNSTPPRLVVLLTVGNMALLLVLLARGTSAGVENLPVLRGRGLELVDGEGQVRAHFVVEPDGEAVFRMRDAAGAIRVKLAAGVNGSGLLLLDETTEPGVQIVARRASSQDRATTSVNLIGTDGRRRSIAP